MGSPDSAKKCIASGGVVMDSGWLRDSARSMQRTRRLLADLGSAHAIASDPELCRAIVSRATRTIEDIEYALFEAAESTPVRDVATLTEQP